MVIFFFISKNTLIILHINFFTVKKKLSDLQQDELDKLVNTLFFAFIVTNSSYKLFIYNYIKKKHILKVCMFVFYF
jgi:hypothetical protein